MSLVIAFAVPQLASAIHPESAPGLEKIPSPEYIKYYQVLEERGNALWGHRLITKEEMKAKIAAEQAAKKAAQQEKKEVKEEWQEEKQTVKATDKAAKKLEKIPAPPYVKFYEGIQQIGNALWGYFKNTWAYGLGRITTDNAPCIAEAMGTRDGSVRAAQVTHDQAMLDAFDVRSACHQEALSQDSAKYMLKALVQCNTDFLKDRKTVWKEFDTARDAAWKQYRDDLKVCGKISNPALEEASEETQEIIDEIDDEGLDELDDDDQEEGESETGE
ncbi:hypothetical protein AMJ57_05060 [Parcubacteria bacterium SG8_24]|nr:MAG: hypothetical protein AMJ57_05060 [Parcubacteria bacterium SG8_24]